MTDFLKLSQEAFEASTTYVDANYRNDWDYSLRAFRNEHAPGSKYLSREYESRSRIFHPKTRSIIRKNEAAAMQAAFSNKELVSTEPPDPDNPLSVAAAEALKEVLQYRLTRTLPTFEIYVGGVQDAQTMGAVCSYQYWEYQKRDGKIVKDRPCIELRPLENLRLDPAASWIDPVNTSPYWCDIIALPACDVKAMMEGEDDKTGQKWKKYDDDAIARARPDVIDSTRQSRLGGRQQDPHTETTPIKAFDIVWVMRWFMKDSQGEDHTFYTLGTDDLLSEPVPLEEVYFHGKRPYVMGCAILETHRAMKTSMPNLVKPLQQAANNIGNQRFDNVQFVLNKRWLVTRGRQTDVQSLVRNVPGGVTLTANAREDIQESNWPDVTSSSYVEHDRLNAEFDDLAGNFSPSTKVANNAVNDTLGGSRLAAAGAGLMTEYLLHTINFTWWTKVMSQLALLERYYETDEVVLTICAKKAQLFPRFGPQDIQKLLEDHEVGVSVDMAMGNPNERLQKFLMAMNACMNILTSAPPGVNVKEICKEICSNAGYRDGERFFGSKDDPRLVKAMQMIQQLQQALQGKQMELQAGLQDTQLKIASNEKLKQLELEVDFKRIAADMQLRNKELDLNAQDNQVQAQLKQLEITKPEPVKAPEPVDPAMHQVEIAEKLANIDLKEAQAQKARTDAAVAQATGVAESEKINAETQKLNSETQAALVPVVEHNEVAQQLREVAQAVASIVPAVSAVGPMAGKVLEMNDTMTQGLGGLINLVMQPKKKPVSITGGRKQGKIVVTFDDGSSDEMAVN